MRIKDVLTLLEPFQVKLLSGDEAVEQQVSMIEVMEVPEVEYWVSEGLLIITTFYSVKNNPDQQYTIIRKLIEAKAAGIIVKVGRFIHDLPRDIIQLCKTHHFPLIILSEDVAYREILRPLNLYLYARDLYRKEQDNIFSTFESKFFESVEKAIEFLAIHLICSIYIEDYQGRLLYSTERIFRDGWRHSRILYSKPTLDNYDFFLQKWAKVANENQQTIYLKQPGIKERLIIPLVLRGKLIAFTHLVFNQRNGKIRLTNKHIHILKEKSTELMLGELADLQKKRTTVDKAIQHFTDEYNHKQFVLLNFERSLNQFISKNNFFPIDYLSLYQKNIDQIIKGTPYIEEYLLIENGLNTFALAVMKDSVDFTLTDLKYHLEQSIKSTLIEDTYVLISSPFDQILDLRKKMSISKKLIRLKSKHSLNDQVMLQQAFGIDAILMELSLNKDAQAYAKRLIGILQKSDPSLLITLKAFLEANRNVTKTAESLAVNRRTITNRLQRISDLLNKDLDDAEDLFTLQFCLKIMQL